jgi:hypothetical protein
MEKRFEYLEALRVHMSDTEILEELVRTMSNWDALEESGEGYLGFICRVNGIKKPEEGIEEFDGTIGSL